MSNTPKDQEALVKQYQLNDLVRELKDLNKKVDGLTTKIDTQATVHNTQIQSLTSTFVTKEAFEANNKLVAERYDPMKKNLSKIVYVLIGIGAMLVGQILLNLLKGGIQ